LNRCQRGNNKCYLRQREGLNVEVHVSMNDLFENLADAIVYILHHSVKGPHMGKSQPG
jgi:hypothetical protein